MNILLFGLGYHARRIYFPILQELQQKGVVEEIIVVDLQSQENIIANYLLKRNAQRVHCTYLLKPLNKRLDADTKKLLKDLVNSYQISGVIIATEPLAHMVYAEWAMKNRLSVLMDKPISTHEGILCNAKLGKRLVADYQKLAALYKDAKKENPHLVFTIMAQRRFHTAFERMKTAIQEVFKQTNCPVTSIQSFHSDGQWRFPTEIIDQTAHPYNQGYGKCSHSGYHFFDIVSWLMEGSDKNPDELNVVSSFTTPNDFVAQFDYSDYRRSFSEFDTYNKYSEKEFIELSKDFGEVDSFNNFTFKKNDKVMTLASINLCHNGFSQRNWPTAAGRDLYKGNGRVRQEMHMIEQGPFQSILYTSFQSTEVNPTVHKNLYDFGGEYHADIYISRNSTFNPKWKTVEKIQVKDLMKNEMSGTSRGHQEDARRRAVYEFIHDITSKKPRLHTTSDLLQYERSVKMMSIAYQSMAQRKGKKNPLITIKL